MDGATQVGAVPIGLVTLLAGLFANAETQRRSVAAGDDLPRMWAKGCATGGAAMIFVMGALIVIANIFNWLTA
ncbi:hypothetical protein [Sphingomonas spermidinifaciens]|uniref:hypothetical protein n=1 Tax=Sphingomonas spermidinifaciens TaxID=1141889 RepID=UPI001144E55C|nr:hypothetical protein [Sphingomonas spermidinifaciens]